MLVEKIRPSPDPTQAPVRWAPGVFPWGKEGGAWLQPPPPSSVEVKGRLELYLYSPSGHSWPVIDRLYLLPLIFGYNLVLFINEDSGKVPWRDLFRTEIRGMLT
jgi:hypothetical protein